MRDEHVHELLAAYALGATAGAECARVEAHVADCAQCREELEEMQHDAALLGMASYEAPPTDLRARVLDSVAAVAAEAPASHTADAESESAPAVVSLDRHRRARRPRMRFALPALGAACVLLVALAAVQTLRVSDLRNDLHDARANSDRGGSALNQVLISDDTTSIDTHGSLASARVVLGTQRNGDHHLVMMQDVPAPPVGKSWQVWGIDTSGAKISLGVVDQASPAAVMLLPESLRSSLDAIAITLERAGGAEQPTTAPLAFGSA